MISSCGDSNYIPSNIWIQWWKVLENFSKSLISFPLGEWNEERKEKQTVIWTALNFSSPVLIPSVGKLNEKHQLDDDEEKTSSSAHITPDWRRERQGEMNPRSFPLADTVWQNKHCFLLKARNWKHIRKHASFNKTPELIEKRPWTFLAHRAQLIKYFVYDTKHKHGTFVVSFILSNVWGNALRMKKLQHFNRLFLNVTYMGQQ